jgi:hypothetical protein
MRGEARFPFPRTATIGGDDAAKRQLRSPLTHRGGWHYVTRKGRSQSVAYDLRPAKNRDLFELVTAPPTMLFGRLAPLNTKFKGWQLGLRPPCKYFAADVLRPARLFDSL